MAIKSWVVKAQKISGGTSGVIAYCRYLVDQEHKNHKDKTEAITPIVGNWRDFVRAQSERAAEKNTQAKLSGRGGRPVETLAHSFVVSLPPELRPTPEQWKRLGSAVCRAIKSVLPDEASWTTGDLFINAHENSNNPHLNILIGKVGPDYQIRKAITQKKALVAAKSALNLAVLNVLGADHAKYEPNRKPKPGHKSGRQRKWAFEKLLAEEAANRAMEQQRASEAQAMALAEEANQLRESLETLAAFEDRGQEIIDEIKARLPPRTNLERDLHAEDAYEAEIESWRASRKHDEVSIKSMIEKLSQGDSGPERT